MSKYNIKFDENGQPINAIKDIVEVEVATSALLTDSVVAVPKGAHSVVIKRLPVATKAKINGTAAITIDEGDFIGPIADEVDSLTITTTATGTAPIIFQFVR